MYRAQLQRALGTAYELREEVGKGGFGTVYEAWDVRLKRKVAVKVLRGDLGISPDLMERFQREAEAVAKLRHPNILPIYMIGEGEGLAYFIMPLIEGETLRAVLDRESDLPGNEARRIATEAASALNAAHDAGLVHRDIKPDNIMLEGKERRVLIMDFGIAKALGSTESTLTGTGMIVGTPHYMSPEQASGEGTIDHRSDIYSLGVVAYRLFAGEALFEGASAQSLIVKHIAHDPTDLRKKRPQLPRAVSDAVMRCLKKDPAERWDSAAEFATALNSVPDLPDTLPVAKRKSWLVAASVAVIALGVVAVAFFVRGSGEITEVATGPTVPSGMALIPAGSYEIGRNEGHRYSRPTHAVELQAFAVERTEVTKAGYRRYLTETGAAGLLEEMSVAALAADSLQPITGVTWPEATAYCTWRYTGGRLPTEAEWEAAARGLESRLYPWGNAWAPGVANTQSSRRREPWAVGSFAAGATPEGVQDLIGNVWEWTSSQMQPYAGGVGPRQGDQYYIIRGGAFNSPDDIAEATYRGFLPPTTANRSDFAATGFRCVVSIEAVG